jgi:hypothetical protein
MQINSDRETVVSAAVRFLNQNTNIRISNLKIVETFNITPATRPQSEQGIRLLTPKADDILDGLVVEYVRMEYLGNNGITINNAPQHGVYR